MTTTQTALMPIDPAVSPAQVSRLLPIRADLLPPEILAGRRGRRTRSGLIAAVIVVLAVLAGWYFLAFQALDTADENLATATDQVQRAQNEKKNFSGVVKVIADGDTVAGDLKSLLANDLPWARNTDLLRANAKSAGVTVDEMAGTVYQDTTAKPAAGTTATIATMTMTGRAPDKQHIAAFLDKLADLDGFADPYMSSASEEDTGWTFAVTVKITTDSLCGRFTTACGTTGGN